MRRFNPNAADGIRGLLCGSNARGCRPRLWTDRRAFTLIELLVVISIILVVAAITLSAVNLSFTGDRIRGAGRQVQSYLEGARGRAVYGGNASSKGAGYQAGVRFIRESNDPTNPRFHLCSSVQFVEIDPTNAAITGGVYGIQYDITVTPNLPTRLVGTVGHPVEESNTHWLSAYQQGLIFDWQVLLLNNRKYQINVSELAAGNEVILLRTPYIGTTPFAAPGDANNYAVPQGRAPEYKILLPPQPMANQEVRTLGNGVVFDLQLSRGLDYFNSQSLPIDVMFSPRGMVVGPITSSGLVQFVVSDREDSLNYVPLSWTTWQQSTSYELRRGVVPTTGEANHVFVNLSGVGTSGNTEPTWVRTPGQTTADGGVTWTCVAPRRERNIVSMTPLTGKTSVHPVYLDPAGLDDDPFRYSETGEVARQ